MKRIRLRLSNYLSINQADIALNGITVLTGPNGSGKTTLAKLLFYYLGFGIGVGKECMDEFETTCPSLGIDFDGSPLSKEGNRLTPSDIGIENVILFESPFALSLTTTNTNSKTFRELLLSEPMELDDKAKMCKKMIQNIICGKVIIKSEEDSKNKILMFRSNKGSEYPLDNASAGVKTFACIQRLIDSGKLTSNTLLIIDGPEANLYPLWVVELARLLVIIHKHLGVSIMVASHNPDMVAALQAIALQERLDNVTKFYLAEPSEESDGRYTYKCLDMNIGPIFESFNRALERIDTYGKVE